MGTTRLTRSKSAAFSEDSTSGAKKPLQSKKATANQPLRKRAALNDLSNVTKGEIVEGKKNVGKGGLVSKASQPTGVQKNLSRTNSSRSALSTNLRSAKTSRFAPGAGKK